MKKNLIINYAMAEIQGEMKKSKNICVMVVAEQQTGYCLTLIGCIAEHHPISVVQTT